MSATQAGRRIHSIDVARGVAMASDARTTPLYALLSATMFDSQIGCWDTKLTYWLIRPWAAKRGPRLRTGLLLIQKL